MLVEVVAGMAVAGVVARIKVWIYSWCLRLTKSCRRQVRHICEGPQSAGKQATNTKLTNPNTNNNTQNET